MALWPQLMSTSLLAMSAGDALWALMPMLMSTSLLSMSAFHDAFGLHKPLPDVNSSASMSAGNDAG